MTLHQDILRASPCNLAYSASLGLGRDEGFGIDKAHDKAHDKEKYLGEGNS